MIIRQPDGTVARCEERLRPSSAQAAKTSSDPECSGSFYTVLPVNREVAVFSEWRLNGYGAALVIRN
jgi:hypothetical protein